MGGKASNNMQSDRPESGGADKNMQREKSGVLDREKEKFAEEQVEKRGEAPDQPLSKHAPFTVGSEPNPTKKKH
jgi:hypothetical protein